LVIRIWILFRISDLEFRIFDIMTDRDYLVSLLTIPSFGPARTKLLVDYFGSAKKAWDATEKQLTEVGLKKERVAEFLEYRTLFDQSGYFERLKCLGINFVTAGDKNYPENLKGLAGAPAALYFRGEIKKADVSAVAIVGSRKMTSYGREVAEKFANELADYGVTIVSGLARGIDSAAHKAALASGGRTLAVLACGLDLIYPPENADLAGKIIKSGALVSEYSLGTPAVPMNFASRNRIISGLAKAVVVVEGAEKSGTLLTATHAAEQGKTVFAVPGQITSPQSFAPLYLLKNGAKIAASAKDVLEELNLQVKVDREVLEKVLPTTPEEQKIIEILANEALHLDEIARISSTNVGQVSAQLTIMEMKGIVKNMGGGMYKRT
jgi:DNA processing protein